IQRMRQRPRSRTVAIARQGTTQRIHRAAMLEKRRSHSGIAGVHVNGSAVLCGAKEDFSEPITLEASSPRRIRDAAVLEIEQLMTAPVWKAPPRGHVKSSRLSSARPSAGLLTVTLKP